MYTQPIDRHHPGCILLLVDQSASMEDAFAAGEQSKATALSLAVNRLLRNLVLQCQRGEEVRDYYHVGVLGYGAAIGPILGGGLTGQQLVPIGLLADYPLRVAPDALPGSPDISVPLPIWIESRAEGGTPMSAAIDLAGSLLVDWANEHLDSFPPIVVNISDGASTDGDPRPMAGYLRDIKTTDGNLLLFNVNLSDEPLTPIEYPSSMVGLPNPYARALFDMSSPLTPYMMAVARGMSIPVQDGARGFVFNADAAKLSEFLDVGTKVSQVTDR
jgi:hypothetical protein